MPVGHSPQTAVWAKQNEVDVNTDDLQKIILSDSDEKAKQSSANEIKKTETKSPVQQIIQGNEQTAKKDLLKNFVQKVASAGMEIFASNDKGKKDTKSINDVKLLFGDDVFKADEITISAEAKMGQLQSAVADSLSANRNVRDDEEIDLDAREKFEEDIFTEKTGVRDEVVDVGEDDEDDINATDEILDIEGDVEIEQKDLIDLPEFDDEAFLITRNDREGGERGDKRGDDGDKERIEEMVEVQEYEEEDAEVEEEVEEGVKKKYGEEDLEKTEEDLDAGGDADDANRASLSEDMELDGFRVIGSDTSRDRGDRRGDDSDKAINLVDKVEETEVLEEEDEDKDDLVDEKDHKDDSDIEKDIGGRIRAETTGDGHADDSELDQQEIKEISEKEKIKVLKEEQIAKTELLEKYTDNYRKYLLNPKKNYFELKEEEGMLLKEFGITSRQLKDIQSTIRNNIKLEVRDSVKDAILQKQLSIMSKFDSVSADAKLNQFTEYFTSNILMGGADFGNFDDNFQGLVNKAMYLASKDLANFAIGELESFVLEEALNSDQSKASRIKSFETKILELNSITNNPKITEEWAQAAMEGFMKNYGLSKEEINLHKNETVGINVNVQTGSGDSSRQKDQRREQHGYEFDADDERGIFINRLRALYLQRALNPGLKTTLDTEFKIRKLKNGLLKLGVYTDVLNERVQEEANEVAKERLMEMLEEALQERASLYDLRGSSYDLIESRIKVILKNGEKMGMTLDKKEFNKIRDKANYEMFEVTKREMEMIGVRLSDEDLPALVLKHREMKKLVDRLKEESGFKDEVNEIGRASCRERV